MSKIQAKVNRFNGRLIVSVDESCGTSTDEISERLQALSLLFLDVLGGDIDIESEPESSGEFFDIVLETEDADPDVGFYGETSISLHGDYACDSDETFVSLLSSIAEAFDDEASRVSGAGPLEDASMPYDGPMPGDSGYAL